MQRRVSKLARAPARASLSRSPLCLPLLTGRELDRVVRHSKIAVHLFDRHNDSIPRPRIVIPTFRPDLERVCSFCRPRDCWMVEWRGALARGAPHLFPRSAIGRWIPVGKLMAVELPSARPLHEPLRCRRHVRLVVCRQACLARRTPCGKVRNTRKILGRSHCGCSWRTQLRRSCGCRAR